MDALISQDGNLVGDRQPVECVGEWCGQVVSVFPQGDPSSRVLYMLEPCKAVVQPGHDNLMDQFFPHPAETVWGGV